MQTLKDFYKFLIKEELFFEAKKQEGEAPRDAEFGRFAFAPTRNDTPTPKEPNTKSEEEARQALISYIAQNKKGPLSAKAEQLWDLHNQGYYSKILSPDQYTEAYRFIRLTKESFAKLVGMEPSKVQMYGVLGPGTLNPTNGNISGWTVSTKLFTKEGFDGYGDGDVIALFVASIQNNKFFGNPGILAKAIGEPHYVAEMETIAVGPVQYTKCSYAKLTEQDLWNDQYFRVRIMRMIRNAGVS
jgi:hypothetical protein